MLNILLCSSSPPLIQPQPQVPAALCLMMARDEQRGTEKPFIMTSMPWLLHCWLYPYRLILHARNVPMRQFVFTFCLFNPLYHVNCSNKFFLRCVNVNVNPVNAMVLLLMGLICFLNNKYLGSLYMF